MKLVLKWVLIVFLILIVGVGGLVWYYGRNWKPIVETKLKEAVHKSTGGLYTLRYDDLDLNIALGNATLLNAELIPDSAVYRQQVLSKEAPNNRYHISLKSLKIRRFSLMDVLSEKRLNIKTIVFEEPSIHLISEYHSYNDTIAEHSQKTLYENVKDIVRSINVKDIKIDNVKFKYSKIAEGNTSSISLEQVNINVHDVLVDETSLADTSRLYYTKMVDVQIPHFEYNLPDGFYKASFENLRINTREQNVLMTKVFYGPKMSKSAFFKNKKRNVTMAVLAFDTLRMEHLDFRRLIDNQQTIAAKVQIKNGSVDLSADKRYPKYPVVKIGHSPHQQLMKAQKLLRLDTVLVDNVTVTYYEMSAKFGREGSISFNHAKGTLTNVTNDTTVLRKDKYMRADLIAQVMGAGRLHAKFGFDMLSKTGYHTYSGTLGAMNATAFNRILHPLLNVGIASGNIKKIAFNMEGNDRKNWGSFKFDYDNLKINLPEKENGKKSKLASFLVNQILINDSNPDANEKYHVGKINYTRVPEHTFFKTLWQSLLEGIKQCAGISPEREAKLLGTAEKVKEVSTEAKGVVKKTGKFFKGLFKKKEKTEGEGN
ncbi:AsmA family protein [Sphingobacterium paucimobilis]|uniref:AsmA-like C-terminal domain-containing protein n=1 Tax=Sphingobacterium paucimobilis HER1398 TaxID=1346330 RepID=U2JFK2_9SPHI|nr:hypothetical protein [Sphingobacterium paucimobilis]ERJ61463.1 hypothetical protein M472_22150 [Sphingobacterium paucimobilis HER1398]